MGGRRGGRLSLDHCVRNCALIPAEAAVRFKLDRQHRTQAVRKKYRTRPQRVVPKGTLAEILKNGKPLTMRICLLVAEEFLLSWDSVKWSLWKTIWCQWANLASIPWYTGLKKTKIKYLLILFNLKCFLGLKDSTRFLLRMSKWTQVQLEMMPTSS